MYTCPSADAKVYVVATSGGPGSGAAPQVVLLKALGSCGSLAAGNMEINEATTVASTYALAPYMKSYNAVGSNSADAQSMASGI